MPSNFDNYWIYYKTDVNSAYTYYDTSSSLTPIIKSLYPNTGYYIRLIPYSNTSGISGNPTDTLITTLPLISSQSFSSATYSSITIGYTGYYDKVAVYYSVDSGSTYTYSNTYTSSSATVNGLSENSQYYFMLIPFNKVDISGTIKYITDTNAVTSAYINTLTSTSTSNSVTLNWTGYYKNAVVYYSADNGSTYTYYNTYTPTTTTTTINGLNTNQQYYFKLTPLNSIDLSGDNKYTTITTSVISGYTHYYPFDNDVLNYATGTGVNDLVFTGTPVYSNNCKYGSYSLQTVSGTTLVPTTYFSLPSITMSSSNGFSLCLWFYYMASPSNRVFEFSNAYSNVIMIYIGGTGGSQCIYQDETNGSNLTFGPNMIANNWYHIALVWNQSANTCKSYFNSIPTTNYSITYNTIRATTRVNNMFGYNYQSQKPFNAGYDDIRIYNGSVLSSTDIANIYSLSPTNAWQSIANLTYFFPFDNDALNYASSYSTGTTGLTLYGSNSTLPTYVSNTNTLTNNLRKKCISFSGITNAQYASITGLSTALSATGYSVAFWINSSKTGSYWGRVITITGSSISVSIALSPADNQIKYQINSSTVLTSTNALTLNAWNFVVLTHSSSTITIYINGSSSGTLSYTIPTLTINNIYVGGYTVYANDYVQGYVSDVAFYNGTVLTATNVSILYYIGY